MNVYSVTGLVYIRWSTLGPRVHIKGFDTSKIFCLRLLQLVCAANRIRSKFTAAQTLLYCKYGL